MDETIKHEVAEDMSEVPADYIEIDYSVIDEGEEQENEKESDKFEEIPAM